MWNEILPLAVHAFVLCKLNEPLYNSLYAMIVPKIYNIIFLEFLVHELFVG